MQPSLNYDKHTNGTVLLVNAMLLC